MDNRSKWISTRIRTGWTFLAIGAIVGIVGIFLELRYSHQPFNYRIVTGLGILLAGIGIGLLVRYWSGLKDDTSARRLSVEVMDERTVLIRSRAGNRAYWVSTALVYIGLMWASFAANGELPALSGDVLWYYLAAALILPFGVYATSILVDQRIS